MATDERRSSVDLDRAFREHATPLLRLAVLLTGDRATAEELVQDAFIRLSQAANPPVLTAERAYLRRTVINLSHGHHRHLRVVRRHPEPQPGTAPTAELAAVRQGDGAAVVAAIRTLPDRQRDCIVLRFYEDLSDAEIADALGISPGSVKTHLHRAKAALADRLEELR
jgi:RNA polymerase sigma-70 factor (sigma-E family)